MKQLDYLRKEYDDVSLVRIRKKIREIEYLLTTLDFDSQEYALNNKIKNDLTWCESNLLLSSYWMEHGHPPNEFHGIENMLICE